MALKKGQPAPDFELYDTDTEPVRLSDFEGENVLLLFFPGAFTSVCTNEMNEVNNELEDYEDFEVQVIGISTDSPFVLNEFREVHQLDFPLLSDHDGEVSALYEAKYDNDFTHMGLDRISRRAAFLIDSDGVVQYAEVMESAGDMPDFDRIKKAVRNLSA